VSTPFAAGDGLSGLFGWTLVTSLPAILVIAWVSGRLLGVKRSLGVTLLSGVVGWVTGTGLALVIGDGDANSPGFTRNVWLFAIIFTMSSAVWVELLARPGMLARAQTGLTSVPRPLRALRRRGERVGRYAQITRIAARHGFGPYLGVAYRPDEDSADGAASLPRRLRHALEECGGMFVKLGQLFSTRSDLLPAAVVEELAHLQDRVAPTGPDAIRELLEEEFDKPVADVFAEIDWQPIASASIGQAYHARLHDGEEVIVKVQRPGIAEAVERDILVLLELAGAVESRTSWGAEYRVVDLATEFADRLREELDFRIEARNTADIAANLDELDDIHIPHIYADLSTSKVLVMEWLHGVSARQVDRIDDLGFDRGKLADVLLRGSLQQMVLDGHFHADPHPGNIMVLEDGRLGLIDFGATGRLDPMEQSTLGEMLVAVNQRDAAALRQAVLEVATLRRGFDDEQLERALARFMSRHLGPGSVPSAAMLNEMLQLFFTFGITLPPEFSTLFRALITLEGALRTLSPGYLVIEAAQQLAARWARDRLAPTTLEDLAKKELTTLLPLLRRAPRRFDRIASLIERGTLTARISLLSDDHDVRTVTKLLNRVVLAFLGGVVGILSAILLSIEGGPPFTGDTTLFQFFGYFGLFCSSVLILRVIVAILHDRLN
jgi:ubiquinone biosynthesis protein